MGKVPPRVPGRNGFPAGTATSGRATPEEFSNSLGTDIAPSTITDVEFQNDTGSNVGFPFHFEIPADGWYRISARCEWSFDVAGERILHVTVFGVPFASDTRGAIGASQQTWNNLTFDAQFSAGDFVGMSVEHTSTTNPLPLERAWLAVTAL